MEAAELYAQLLADHRVSPEYRAHYQQCFRRAQQVRRQRDSSYRQQIESLTLDSALKVYGEVLAKLQQAYVDQDKATLPLLFREGVQEVQNGLNDPAFRRIYLETAESESIREFRDDVLLQPDEADLLRREDLQAKVRAIALTAKAKLGLNASLVVLEFACGACAGLDEYTHYLTPDQLVEAHTAWKGDYTGVGIDLALSEQGLVVDHVVPGSPAHVNGIKAGDRLLRIGDKRLAELKTENPADLLKGDNGTIVEVEVAGGSQHPRVVRLKRRSISLPSVSEPRFLDERLGIAYLQVAAFRESTVQEVDSALAKLQAAGMTVLILDLRSNWGGLFEVATQVSERFLSTGIIAFTRGHSDEFNTTYRAHAVSSLAVPLVVLIDSETASSAEMLAGALKENHRATLVGQTTFGKGTIQKLRSLHSVPAAIRMTVAKFYSPEGHPYADLGVSPSIVVERGTRVVDLDHDPQVQAALEVARPLAVGR
jgi:carboxyl-terminal processing protease